MNKLELKAWQSFFVRAENKVLNNNKASNFEKLVNVTFTAFRNFKCNMSIRMHYLHLHMDRFPEKLGAMSDEQGERFHQDIREMESRYQGRWDTVMMADYCWTWKRDIPAAAEHTRKVEKQKISLQFLGKDDTPSCMF